MVLAGLAYVLGYLSWAMYASDRGLGLVPVLDAQYFAAGVLPSVIVATACFTGWWLRWVGRWVRKPVSPFGAKMRSLLELIGLICTLAGGILYLFFKRSLPVLSGVMFVIGAVVLVTSAFLSRDKIDVWYHRFVLGQAWFSLPLVGMVAFLLYAAKVFPVLPQAFGGPRPQRVQLDIDVSKISPATLHLLAPEWQSQANLSVARSRTLRLIFQSRDYVFLQIDDEGSSAPNQSLRLQSGSVLSLVPVTDPAPP